MKKLIITLVFVVAAWLNAAAENYPYRSDYLWVTVPDHADWLYQTGEKAKLKCSCINTAYRETAR